MLPIFPIAAIDRITTNNLHRTYLCSANLIAQHLHVNGYIHAEARSMPLCQVSHNLTDNAGWETNVLVNKDMLRNDPISFLINASRNYVEIPEYSYSVNFFKTSLTEIVATLNIVLSRYSLICDAPEPFMRIFGSSKYTPEKRRVLAVRQERYFRAQAEKICDDDGDEPDFSELCQFEDFDDSVPIVQRGIECGSYQTSDEVPLIKEQVVDLCDAIFTQNSTKDVQTLPDAISQFTVKIAECVAVPQRNYADIVTLQSIKDAVFSLPSEKIVPYADYLLSTPDSTHAVMCDTPQWSLTRHYRFFFACKGAGKSTFTAELHRRRIGLFEDEHLMKLIPYHAPVDKAALDVWRETISDEFIMLILMAVARGDHVIWSISNFLWYATRFPWLRGITGVVLKVSTVYQHPGRSLREMDDKRRRDAQLADNMVDNGYPIRYARNLACALNANDSRSHENWMYGSTNDISYFGEDGDG